jgi:hypothetical protein
MEPSMSPGILTAIIAASAGIAGVVVKTIYDATIERIKVKRENRGIFFEERRVAYDEFLASHNRQLKYQEGLKDLALIARAGKQVKPEILSAFPDSSLPDLVNALEKIRKLTRTYAVVEAAESIVSLHGDISAATRLYGSEPSAIYGLPLFLGYRLIEDKKLEFIAAYRHDLGIGHPEGARKNFPKIERKHTSPDPEETLRNYLKCGPHILNEAYKVSDGAELEILDIDRGFLDTPKIRAMIQDQNESHPEV